MSINHEELKELVKEIDDAVADSCLSDWEINFIADLIDKTIRTFTPRQAGQIQRIHREKIL